MYVCMCVSLSVLGGEGGTFSFLCWSISQVLGSIAYDVLVGDIDTEQKQQRKQPHMLTSDSREEEKKRKQLKASVWIMAVSVALMFFGYLLACFGTNYLNFGRCYSDVSLTEPTPCQFTSFFANPFGVDNEPRTIWSLTEDSATLPFQCMTGGLFMGLCAVWFLLWDVYRMRSIPVFTTFGINALACYFVHFSAKGRYFALFRADTPGPVSPLSLPLA